jgi:site-specific DNA recombinase
VIAERPPEQLEPTELRALRDQLSQLEAILGFNQAIEQAKQNLRQQIQSFQLQVKQADNVKSENRELLLQVFGDRSYWKTLLDEEKQEIFRALVERIIVRDGKVEQVILKV